MKEDCLPVEVKVRFELDYIRADGEKYRPHMLHRVIFGSIERFVGILIEHYAGNFPTWIAPVQVNNESVSVRKRDAEFGKQELGEMGIDYLIELVQNEKYVYNLIF